LTEKAKVHVFNDNLVCVAILRPFKMSKHINSHVLLRIWGCNFVQEWNLLLVLERLH